MNQVMTDIWPFLVTAILAAIGWQFRESYLLKTKVAVMDKSIEGIKEAMKTTTESIKEAMKTTTENFQKSIEHIQGRQDSHSKKQDAVMDLLTDFKMEMLKEVGTMSSNVSGLASDVKNLSNLISITDVGIKVDNGHSAAPRKKKK